MAKIEISIPDWLDKICAWPLMVYRKRKYGYSFRRIPLDEGKFTLVDPADYYRFNNFHWSAIGEGDNFYAVRCVNDPKKGMKVLRLHREIMNAPAGVRVDHKNNNSLDNHRENLRLATRSQNMWNRRKTKSKTRSRFKGVSFHKQHLRWGGQIQYKGKKIWLGYFDSEEEAARAYDRAAIKYYGEFARLNFPREDYINETANSK